MNFERYLLGKKKVIGVSQPAPLKFINRKEVRNLIKISPGTLQNLRINGTLKFTKIGSIIYYKNADVQKLLAGGKRV